ncbi:MAG: 1,4-dihydroxy-2-naphthoate octaprenyltransferase, partial [Muribaculaceae bacterium]|nr:1,4-dihydroxy-2-naphthoate octaprenyltransferase [Muribaculaceae bacterium]
RAGPRRGVTEGDIKPTTLKRVTFITLIAAMAVGCGLLPFAPEGKWWLLVVVGVLVAMFALAYSAGPYPLSYHALGEPAVFIFYGLVPVNFTYFVVAGRFDSFAVMASIAIGLMGVNVLLVNNYRDVDDDREAGKRTIAVVLGRSPLLLGYFFNGFLAMAIMSALWVKIFLTSSWLVLLVPLAYLVLHVYTWMRMSRSTGAALNPVLAATARNMLLFSVALAVALGLFCAQ